MMKTIKIILLSIFILGMLSCEENIQIPTGLKIRVIDSSGKPVSNFSFYFAGDKSKGILNRVLVFDSYLRTDKDGTCAYSSCLPQETEDISLQIIGDSLYIPGSELEISIDSINYVRSNISPYIIKNNLKIGAENKFFFRVSR